MLRVWPYLGKGVRVTCSNCGIRHGVIVNVAEMSGAGKPIWHGKS